MDGAGLNCWQLVGGDRETIANVEKGFELEYTRLIFVPAPNVVGVLLTAILCFSAFTF